MSSSLPPQVSVPSFSKPNLKHEVDPFNLTCSCIAQATYGHEACTHSKLVNALHGAFHYLEGAHLGLLADYRTEVIILPGADRYGVIETDYERTDNGFEPGAWQHFLAWDRKNLIRVSWHIDYGFEVIADVVDVHQWDRGIPRSHRRKEVKNLYRRPNYELSERPLKR